MNVPMRRLLLGFTLVLLLVLATAGTLLRAFVARTLRADAEVQTAFLDLFLRDRSQYLAETLRLEREQRDWPPNLPDILTRHYADFNRDIFMQVFEPDGVLLAASGNAPPGVGLSARAAREGTTNPIWLSHETVDARGRPVRLVTYPIRVGDPDDEPSAVIGFAQAGLRLPQVSQAVARFTWMLIAGLTGFGGLLVLLLYAAISTAAMRLRREAEALQAAQHRFVGDAAHELGTPLAIVQGEIDLALRRERTAPEYRAALASCREEIQRLHRLSENLLVLATADAGQHLLHPASCDLIAVVRTVHRRFVRLATEKGVAFTVDAPDALPWRGDALALEQILGNLVANALRHTPSGESMTISVSREPETIVVQVRDTGEGIPAAHLPMLFDRFHRIDKARSRAVGGAGLGLAIVKTLVAAHGGTVSVTSTLGQGSTFTCRFPDLAPRPPHDG